LLYWPTGAKTGWHDHTMSAGAFLTVSGTLSEHTSHGHQRIDRTLIAGKRRSFAPGHVHNVSNVGLVMALSVHLYTAHLTSRK